MRLINLFYPASIFLLSGYVFSRIGTPGPADCLAVIALVLVTMSWRLEGVLRRRTAS
jgi:hypothetical protein